MSQTCPLSVLSYHHLLAVDDVDAFVQILKRCDIVYDTTVKSIYAIGLCHRSRNIIDA